MKIAIYSRGVENDQLKDIHKLFEELIKNGVEPVFFQDFFNQFYSSIDLNNQYSTFNAFEDLDSSIDCVLSLGGDGTMLDTVTMVRDSGIPVLGINYGRLGFLANIGRDEIQGVIDAIAERKYVLDKRTLIHLDANVPLFGETPYALNEFSIHKRDTSPMIKIHTYLNGEFLNSYWADGIIVATPTGSTGYNMSCNGPILFPDSASFVITPVAPHNLNVRSIIVPDSSVISFEIEGRTEELICALDARKEIVAKNIELAVKIENFAAHFIRLNENSYLSTLRTKLTWGLDKRN
jgi:NAD+ kinase